MQVRCNERLLDNFNKGQLFVKYLDFFFDYLLKKYSKCIKFTTRESKNKIFVSDFSYIRLERLHCLSNKTASGTKLNMVGITQGKKLTDEEIMYLLTEKNIFLSLVIEQGLLGKKFITPLSLTTTT